MAQSHLPAWQKLAAAIDSGVVLIVGPSDSGKTTLARYLLQSLVARGRRVALVDCDMGQSTIGPPGTLGMAYFPNPEHLQRLPESAADCRYYFVGHFSPVGHLLQTVVGARHLVREARRLGAEVTLVDTTGLVFGGIGAHLKIQKASLLRPLHVILLQRQGELEHLHRLFRTLGARVHELRPPAQAKRRSFEQRHAYRDQMLRRWLGGAASRELEFPGIVLWNAGHYVGVPVNEALLQRAAVVLKAEVAYGEIGGRALFLVVESGLSSQAGMWRRSASALLKELFHVDEVIVQDASTFGGRLVALEGEDFDFLALAVVDAIDFRRRRFFLRTCLTDLAAVSILQFGSASYRLGG